MKLKVTLRKSVFGRGDKQIACLRGLGITRINRCRVLEDTPAVRGMINKVTHLVECQQVGE